MSIADRDPSVSEAVAVRDPPNLKGTMLARTESRVELDVKELDRFHDDPAKDDA